MLGNVVFLAHLASSFLCVSDVIGWNRTEREGRKRDPMVAAAANDRAVDK